MISFLKNHFDGVPDGWITLWMKHKDKEHSVTKWYNLQDETIWETLRADALKADADGWDCYFSTCPGSMKKSSRERIQAKEVIWIPAFFMDIDTKLDSSKASMSVPDTQEAAVEALNRLPFPPTAIINSGNGIHAYWKLDEPVKVFSENLSLVTNQLKAFAQTVSKAMGYSDLDISASEPARVLRIPDTHNHKRDPLKRCAWLA